MKLTSKEKTGDLGRLKQMLPMLLRTECVAIYHPEQRTLCNKVTATRSTKFIKYY